MPVYAGMYFSSYYLYYGCLSDFSVVFFFPVNEENTIGGKWELFKFTP